MQCWLVRLAEKKWGIPAADVSRIFRTNGVYSYIADLYDLLHLSSYACALTDVEKYLAARGALPC